MTSTVTYGITVEIYSLGTDSRTAYGIISSRPPCVHIRECLALA